MIACTCLHIHTLFNCMWACFVCVLLVFFLKKNAAADEDDHALHATINSIQEDGEVALLHYLKTQHELLKKKYGAVKQPSKVISPLTSFYQPVYNAQWFEGPGTYSDLRFK